MARPIFETKGYPTLANWEVTLSKYFAPAHSVCSAITFNIENVIITNLPSSACSNGTQGHLCSILALLYNPLSFTSTLAQSPKPLSREFFVTCLCRGIECDFPSSQMIWVIFAEVSPNFLNRVWIAISDQNQSLNQEHLKTQQPLPRHHKGKRARMDSGSGGGNTMVQHGVI